MRREIGVSPTTKRAVSIHEHFDTLATDGEESVISTDRRSVAKNRPSAFKSSLEDTLGEELAWSQVYRAMQTAAELFEDEYQYLERPKEKGDGRIRELHRTSEGENDG